MSSFPARFIDEDGITRLGGLLEFTSNDPGGGNPLIGFCQFGSAVNNLNNNLAMQLALDGTASGDGRSVIETGPVKIAPGGNVVTGASTTLVSSGVLPLPVADDLDYAIELIVSDATVTNRASGVVQGQLSQPVQDITFAMDLTGITFTVTDGVDLTQSGIDLQTTAGGVFYITASYSIQWD